MPGAVKVPCPPGRVQSSLTGSIALDLEDPSQVGSARRAAGQLARRLGLRDEDAGRVALAVTEVAQNLVNHAGGGRLVAWGTPAGPEAPAVEVVAIDRGPGLDGAAFRDGFSTGGTKGNGLGAIRRMATALDLWSRPGEGTVLWFRIEGAGNGAGRQPFELGAVSTPKPGETAVGDAWGVIGGAGDLRMMVSDGLGHGPLAAAASREALRAFCDRPAAVPEDSLLAMHEALRPTRGAAIAVARLLAESSTVRFAGVGNIVGAVIGRDGTVRRAISHNGTVGHGKIRIQAFDYPLEPGGLLILHSDGLSASWRLGAYPGLEHRHPAVVAGVLHRDFARSRDDATVLVARLRAGGAEG